MHRILALATSLLLTATACQGPTKLTLEQERAKLLGQRAKSSEIRYEKAVQERTSWLYNGRVTTDLEWKALDAVIERHRTDALKNILLATETDPENAELFEVLALIRYQAKAYDDAIEAAEEARYLDASLNLVYLIRAHRDHEQAVELRRGGKKDDAQSLMRSAIADLKRWIRSNPIKTAQTNKEWIHMAQWARWVDPDAEGEGPTLDGEAWLDPGQDARTLAYQHWRRGRSLQDQKRVWIGTGEKISDLTLRTADRAIEANLRLAQDYLEAASYLIADRAEIYENLAMLKREREDYAGAISSASQAIRIRPKSSRGYESRAYGRLAICYDLVVDDQVEEAAKLARLAIEDMTTWSQLGPHPPERTAVNQAVLKRWTHWLETLDALPE